MRRALQDMRRLAARLRQCRGPGRGAAGLLAPHGRRARAADLAPDRLARHRQGPAARCAARSRSGRAALWRRDPKPARAEQAEAAALAEELGYLPLALAQAHAYMAEHRPDLRRLPARCSPRAASRPAARRGVPNPTTRPVLLTWDISLEAAERQCPAARPLLGTARVLLAPTRCRARCSRPIPRRCPRACVITLARDDAVAALTRFSLITAADGTHGHPPPGPGGRPRRARRGDRQGPGRDRRPARGAGLPGTPWDHTELACGQALLPHALAAAEAAERSG